MSKIENASRKSPFFTDNKTKDIKERPNNFLKDGAESFKTKEMAQSDAKVSIPEATKLFSQIKKAADNSEPVDKSQKIEMLKKEIEQGKYEIDEDGLVEKIARNEFQVWRE